MVNRNTVGGKKMYFDPLSSWLVALIADGIVVAGERSRGGSASEYDQKRVKQANEMLNSDIRRVKDKYGLKRFSRSA